MKEGMHIFDMKLKEKYGPTYGTHVLGKPDLASSDLEILRRVMVKDFSHFEDRVDFIKVNPKDDYSLQLNALSVKTGDEWRRIRNTITPAFTTGKIKRKYQDFFQLLINAIDDENEINQQDKDVDSDIIHEEISKTKKNGISKIELLAQSWIVLVAGYETTAFTLQMVIYIISKIPEIQEKMRDEIMEVIGDKTEIDYDDITKLKYINQVVQETLRMYPPAAR
uniref:Cytochrome P450 n=1 Tax=Acrobeloides nanus TaxID=290746 RepID=A0A914CD05_9BILA